MVPLTLQTTKSSSTTLVSNHFIDEYMADANGEFIKIYLYLLRCVGSEDTPLSISVIADKFEHTEKDVERALKYWEKVGLVRLEYNSHKVLSGLCFLDFPMKKEAPACVSIQQETAAAKAPVSEQKKPAYTANKLLEFKNNGEIKQLIFIAEQYLTKTLSPNDISTLLYFYDELHFSTDLIEYLIEYCVSKGSKSMRYMETVALSWVDEQITTVAAAKESTNLYNKNCFSVLKAFGIKGRNPVESEVSYIKKWIQEYGFTLNIIVEACNRTIQKTHQPSFEYADSILESWFNNKVRSLDDIKVLDTQYQKTRQSPSASPAKLPASNKFNNFQQRSYDYDTLEKQLLNSK